MALQGEQAAKVDVQFARLAQEQRRRRDARNLVRGPDRVTRKASSTSQVANRSTIEPDRAGSRGAAAPSHRPPKIEAAKAASAQSARSTAATPRVGTDAVAGCLG